MNPESRKNNPGNQGGQQDQNQPRSQGQPGRPQQDQGKHGNQAGNQKAPAEQRGQNIEVPGRPDADSEQNRGKAYGPGGARQSMGAGPQGGPGRTSSDQDQPIQEPRANQPGQQQGNRTGQGSDTTPL